MDAAQADVPLNRDVFLRSLIRALSGHLEEIVGLEEASGYIALVGQSIGSELNEQYRRALQCEQLSREQVADILVDLKRRIEGTFEVVSQDDDHIAFYNSRCPFEEKVEGRTSMCMMTSNVFGVIAAENPGYGRVELKETIAAGDNHCSVILHLKPDPDGPPPGQREYFRA